MQHNLFTTSTSISSPLAAAIAAARDEIRLSTTTASSGIISGLHNNNSVKFENTIINQLCIIREIYNYIWELIVLINKCYGLSLLINIGNDFLSVTSNAYWMFLNFKRSPNTFIEFLEAIGSAVWSIPHFFNLIVIIAICHWTVNSANDIAIKIHRIQMDLSNLNYNLFIGQFSLQLLHQKITFTAFGFFNIDFTLLYTIIGAATTYLIILIQFHMSELKNSGLSSSAVLPQTSN